MLGVDRDCMQGYFVAGDPTLCAIALKTGHRSNICPLGAFVALGLRAHLANSILLL